MKGVFGINPKILAPSLYIYSCLLETPSQSPNATPLRLHLRKILQSVDWFSLTETATATTTTDNTMSGVFVRATAVFAIIAFILLPYYAQAQSMAPAPAPTSDGSFDYRNCVWFLWLNCSRTFLLVPDLWNCWKFLIFFGRNFNRSRNCVSVNGGGFGSYVSDSLVSCMYMITFLSVFFFGFVFGWNVNFFLMRFRESWLFHFLLFLVM